jgi:hypothetical protein
MNKTQIKKVMPKCEMQINTNVEISFQNATYK